MKKEIDWTNLDEAQAGVPVSPEIELKPQIEAEVARIEELINRSEVESSKVGRKLVSYASCHDGETYFVRCTAIRQVLGHYGVLDTYDWQDQLGQKAYAGNGRGLPSYRETGDGWTMEIPVPGREARFQVLALMSVVEDTEVERHTFNYIARK